jgi:hypothetical protein
MAGRGQRSASQTGDASSICGLNEVYAITIEDAGFDDEFLKSHWEEKEPPFEFVRWFAKSTIWSQESQFGYIRIK